MILLLYLQLYFEYIFCSIEGMKDELTAAAQRAIQKATSLPGVSVAWGLPQQAAHGDLSTQVALQIAKEANMSPKEIAQAIAAQLCKVPGVENAEVAGPGYVNVWLQSSVLLAELSATQNACHPQESRTGAPVIIDYCGPNIAKPLGVHHLGSHIIGQAIVNLSKHMGYQTLGWSYPGDWGTQFGKLAVAYEQWGGEKPPKDCTTEELLALYVRFHQEAEQDPELEDRARATFRRMEEGDADLRAFWKDVVAVSQRSLEALYERLHISIDIVTGESFYEEKMQPILEEGIKKGVFREGEGGSLIVEFPEESGLPPFLVRKSDGSTLYSTRDLAMIRYRLDTYHPQALYYVVDVAQSLHFKQLEATCRQLQWDLPEFEHTVFGRMRFKDASMSTRKGNVLRLEEVLDEAVVRAAAVIKEHGDQVQAEDPDALAEMMGIGAVAYGILSQNRKQDIVFDWAKMLSFDGNSAPYLQYTHARARSVLRKAGSAAGVPMPADVAELSVHERTLINTLLQFPRVLQDACAQRMPHLLTNYLFSLCQEYNSFYNTESILQAEEPQRSLRLALTAHVSSVLKSGAELLTIRVPDFM